MLILCLKSEDDRREIITNYELRIANYEPKIGETNYELRMF